MTQLGELLIDSQTIDKMTDAEFDSYWTAIGTAARIASQAAARAPETPAARTEINNTAAATERAWTPARQTRPAPFGFGHAEKMV